MQTTVRRRHRVLTVVVLGVLVFGVTDVRTTSWPNACGDGRVDAILDDFDALWVRCCTADDAIPLPTLRIVPGCRGQALAVDYDLTNVAPGGTPNAGQSWVVIVKPLATVVDLRAYTHIR